MTSRYAIYFTPPADNPLTRAAASWLGRDAFANAQVQRPKNTDLSPGEIAYHTAAARRYGFHATLKAPFRLRDGESEASLLRAFQSFSAATDPVEISGLTIDQLDGFFALVPQARNAELDRLAGNVVLAFDDFRAPASRTEIEKRNPDALDPAALGNLRRWGYPYVFDQFRFHMTLTGRVSLAERERIAGALGSQFAGLLSKPAAIDSLALFVEPEPGAPFMVRSFHPLGRQIKTRTA